MRKIILALSLALICTSFPALAKESNQSDSQITLINLLNLAGQNELNLGSGLNITQVARGENASVNLVLGLPGSALKRHYHNSRDEITYCIKGQALMNISGTNYTVKAGDLMYVPAMVPHGSVVTGNETLELISIFVPPFDGKDRIYI